MLDGGLEMGLLPDKLLTAFFECCTVLPSSNTLPNLQWGGSPWKSSNRWWPQLCKTLGEPYHDELNGSISYAGTSFFAFNWSKPEQSSNVMAVGCIFAASDFLSYSFQCYLLSVFCTKLKSILGNVRRMPVQQVIGS